MREVPGSNPGAPTIFRKLMPLSSKVFLSIFLLAVFGFAVWLVHQEVRTPQNEREVMDRQIDLLRAGRYDKAVQVIQTWMNDSKRDASRDGLLCQQVAMAYIAKAYNKPSGKEEAIRQAELNLERELDLYNKENVATLQVDLLEIGLAHEALGDRSDTDKCWYYGKALEELTRQLSLIVGDSYESDGKRFPLEPVRRKIKERLGAVDEKAAKTGCPKTRDQ